LQASFERTGSDCQLFANPVAGADPLMLAERIENAALRCG